jgi:hypothetical protein
MVVSSLICIIKTINKTSFLGVNKQTSCAFCTNNMVPRVHVLVDTYWRNLGGCGPTLGVSPWMTSVFLLNGVRWSNMESLAHKVETDMTTWAHMCKPTLHVKEPTRRGWPQLSKGTPNSGGPSTDLEQFPCKGVHFPLISTVDWRSVWSCGLSDDALMWQWYHDITTGSTNRQWQASPSRPIVLYWTQFWYW